MKQLKFLVTIVIVSIATIVVRAQETKQKPQDSAAAKSDFQWLILAKQITALYNKYDFYKENEFGQEEQTKAQLDAFDTVNKLESKLDELPKEQTILAFRYMMEHATNEELRQRSAGGLYMIPSVETVSYVLPLFRKMSTKAKLLWLRDAENYVLLHPEVPQYREFPRFVLQQAAEGKIGTPQDGTAPRKLSNQELMAQGLISQSAGLLMTVVTEQDKQWIHQALARDYTNSGLWGTLTFLNDLTPTEVQKARAMFPAFKANPVAKVMLATALSPYDPAMASIVKNAMEAELKAKINIKVAPQAPTDDQSQNPQMLTFLRVWDLKMALPYLYRCLHAPNPKLRGMAMLVLALRSPQDILRVAAAMPDTVRDDNLLASGFTLALFLNPQLKTGVIHLYADSQDRELRSYDGEERWNENLEEYFQGSVGQLQIDGIDGAFVNFYIPDDEA